MESRIVRLWKNRRVRELSGLLVVVFALASLLSVLSYDGSDRSWSQTGVAGSTSNWIGPVGANLAEAYLQLFGVIAFLVPFGMAILGWRLLRPAPREGSRLRPWGYGALFLFLAALVELLFGGTAYGGQTFHAGGPSS